MAMQPFPRSYQRVDLGIDRQFTIPLQDTFQTMPPHMLGYGDIVISVQFQPWVIPVRRSVDFRFQTHLEPDGKLYWEERP